MSEKGGGVSERSESAPLMASDEGLGWLKGFSFVGTIVLIGVLLIFLQSILVPFTLAVFLTYLVRPFSEFISANLCACRRRRQERGDEEEKQALLSEPEADEDNPVRGAAQAAERGLPRWVGVVLAIVLALLMVVALIAAIFASLNSLGPMLPQYATRATELWQGFLHWVKSMGLGNLQDLSNAPNAAIRGVISPVFTSLGGFFTDFALIIVFLIFLLLEPPAARSSLRKKIDDSVSRYIILKSLICLFVSVFVYFTMLILQFPLALLIALLTFVLTFLPNVGPALAVLLPVPIAVLDVNISIAQDVFAILIPALVHLSVGNLLEPRLFGKQFNLSPVILLFSLGLWFVLWGVAGAVLAIPLTSTLRIVSGYLMQNGMGLPYTAALHQILEGRPIDLGLSPEEIARARATFAPGAEEGRPSVKSEIMAQVGAVGQQGKSLVSSGVEKSSSLIEKLPFFGKKPEAEKE